jgi:hypothetical protein
MIAMNKRSVVTLIAAIIAVLVSGMLVVPAASAAPASVSASAPPADTCPKGKPVDPDPIVVPDPGSFLTLVKRPQILGSVKVGSTLRACWGVYNPSPASSSIVWYRLNDDGTKTRLKRGEFYTVTSADKGAKLVISSKPFMPGYDYKTWWSKPKLVK